MSAVEEKKGLCTLCRQNAQFDTFEYCKKCIDMYDALVDPKWDKTKKPISSDDDDYEFQGPQCIADERFFREHLKKIGVLKVTK